MEFPNYHLTVDNYNLSSWSEDTDIEKLFVAPAWKEFFQQEMDEEYFEKLATKLKNIIKKGITIYPPPGALTNIFNILPPHRINVVIIGQDPYPGEYTYNGREIPHATGISFSTAKGVPLTSSLLSIYGNMVKYKHVTKMPSHGCLIPLVEQGCFFINTALTVTQGKPKSHSDLWVPDFGKHLITYLSKTLNNLVFVLWGADALKMKQYIDHTKHSFVISSHPSGQGAYSEVTEVFSQKQGKPPKKHPPFVHQDHWTKVNEALIKYKRPPIICEALNYF
jgi:uracil-DNA glycosylase